MRTPTFKVALLSAIASVGATTALAAIPAQAQPRNTVTTHVVVHYGDLKLNTNGGAERLYVRLDRAAERACGAEDWDQLFIETWSAIHACEQTAITRAVSQVDSPKLTAVYDRHFQRAPSAKAAAAPAAGASSASVG